MRFELLFTEHADDQLNEIELSKDKKAICKAVKKILGFMETNLKHPSLNTHKYDDIEGPNGEDVFESYVQNKTPGAYRIFWHYGPVKGKITILEICPHPGKETK
jgi:hypothetical protein